MIQFKSWVGYSLFLTLLYAIWLREFNWNLGFTIVNSVFLIIVWREFKGIKRSRFLKTVWMISLCLGVYMAIRDYWFARFLGVLSMFILDSILVTVGQEPKAKLTISRLFWTKFTFISKMFSSWGELLTVLSRFKNNTKEIKYRKILTGIIMSIPLLVVFGTLFYNADPIFAKIIESIKLPTIRISDKTVWEIVATIGFFGVAGGVFRNRLVKQVKNTKWLQSVIEINVAVTILEILFLVFTVVQIKYFLATPDDLKKLQIIFSEYTRKGYGQMIVASILAYLVVLRLEFANRSIANKWTKLLLWTMIVEIFVLIVAATKRNYVYQSFYGFTDIRLLGFSLSAWLVAMLTLLSYKVKTGRKTDFFVRGIILVTAISVLGINVADIDGLVVRTKPASLDSGVDYQYMSNLSNDAWPGWEKIVLDAENKSKEQSFEVLDGPIDTSIILERLGNKREFLESLSNNHWNWGGNFNYSNVKSLNYLQKNKVRIDELINKLRDQEKEFLYKNCVKDVYQVLRKDFEGKVWMEGDNAVLKVGVEMGPSEEAKMMSKVDIAARNNGMKWSWKMDWITENKKPMKVYKMSCTR